MGAIVRNSAGTTSKAIFQDNELAELLEGSGKKSSLKRTRHINIRYFLVTDAIAKEECEVKWMVILISQKHGGGLSLLNLSNN